VTRRGTVKRDVLDIIAEAGRNERMAKDELRRWVPVAREEGHTWAEIAKALEVRTQSAHERFRNLVSA
jgi:hypothetical protein